MLTGRRSQLKRGEKLSNADENKVEGKRESEKPCTVSIHNSTSVSLINLDNQKYGNDGRTSKGGVLVTQ